MLAPALGAQQAFVMGPPSTPVGLGTGLEAYGFTFQHVVVIQYTDNVSLYDR